MAWESIGSISTGQMPNDASWIEMSLALAKKYIVFVCGEAPEGSKLEVMWHDHELGSYPSLGVWSDYEQPWDYINSCERALEAFDDAVAWDRLKAYMEEQTNQEDDEDEEDVNGENRDADPTQLEVVQDELFKAFKSKAAHCAHEVLQNAMYVEKELPSIDIADSYRGQIIQACSALAGTKHDVISELVELDEIVATASSADVQRRVRRIVNWFREGIPKLHDLVRSLESTCHSEPRNQLAYLLVAESATNILNAFVEMSDAADRYLESGQVANAA